MFRVNKVLIVVTMMGLLLAGCQPIQPASELRVEDEGSARQVSGEVFFPSVPEWGGVAVSLDFDLQESDPATHAAIGHVNWRNFSPEPFGGFNWKAVHAEAERVFFGEDVPGADPDSVVLVAKIQEKEGWGQGEPGEYAYFWLRDGGHGNSDEWGMRTFSFDPWYEFYPPDSPPEGYFTLAQMQEEDPLLPLTSELGDVVIQRASRPAEPVTAAVRRVTGEYQFPSPAEWGVDLWITQEIEVTELDPLTHEATGVLDFGVYDFDQREWKRVKSDVKYVLFDEPAQAAMVISQITEKMGPGEGEPGEYACFWVRDSDVADQFGIHYYSDFHPEVGFKEYFPADELPLLQYAEPGEVIAVENGELTIVQ